MKNKTPLFMIIMINMIFVSYLAAQDTTETQDNNGDHNQVFVDDDGDGYNDNAPDHDGDGIPNGLDPDWIKLKKEQKKNQAHRFVDLDGDGIDDNLQKNQQNRQRAGNEMTESAGSIEEGNRQQKGQKMQRQKGKK